MQAHRRALSAAGQRQLRGLCLGDPRPRGIPAYTALACRAVPSQIFAPNLLDGQVAVVTGGGSGLGRATALELSALRRDAWS